MKYLSILLFLSIPLLLCAEQKLGLDTRFHGFFNNREYSGSTLATSQTIGGVWVAANLKYSLDSLHHLRVGGLYQTQFGHGRIDMFLPEINYEFTSKLWLVKVGFYNMDTLTVKLPRWLWQDSLFRYKTIFSGALVHVGNSRYHQYAWLDWFGFQTAKTREAFSFGTLGEYELFPLLDFKNMFMLNHIAGTLDGESVRDNAQVSVGLETNIDRLWKNHSLPLIRTSTLQVGANYIFSSNRVRPDPYITSHGLNTTLMLGIWRAKFIANYYFGQGHQVYWGDPFYRTEFNDQGLRKLKHYLRMDLKLDFLQTRYVNLCVMLTLHVAQGKLLNEQLLTASFNLGDKTIVRF